ncbi:MAG: type IV pilus modification protein PilV [Gammaproteobacteria bacterium]|nr:MAG: type IV pilus modification protein PilV [Gammaproteobacteria bacterium]
MSDHLNPCRHQRGVGIIEVLVALVVISFGVLGMAGLQLTGIKHTTSSYNRAKALLLIENMATRMRINHQAVIDGDYAGFDTANGYDCAVKPTPYCQDSPTGAGESCTSGELAAFDLFSVACGACLKVACNDSPCKADSAYTISITWTERSSPSDDTTETRNVSMRLRP